MKASLPAELEGLPDLKPEDMAIFGKLMKEVSTCGAVQDMADMCHMMCVIR
jgi:hypothetical protein